MPGVTSISSRANLPRTCSKSFIPICASSYARRFFALRIRRNVPPAAKVQFDGTAEIIDLHVRPLRQSERGNAFFLVFFERPVEGVVVPPVESRHEAVNRELDEEVQFLKEQLNATTEQYEASAEELKASNEELQAMNEEMRSAAEELETSKEELQSVNEELATVNHELKKSIEDSAGPIPT